MSPYPLDNDDQHAARHHELLSALFDPFCTQRALALIDLRGKRCLEVGAGGGAFARWLAGQVGPGGHVLATDLKPSAIPDHPRLSVMQHDLRSAEPLGRDWDYVHARLTLGHLPERREILGRLVACLRSGGVIHIDDWDASRTDMVMHAPDPDAGDLYTLFQQTLGAKVFAAAGTDRTWARRIHAALLEEGLCDVETVMHARAWPGGSPGCQLVASTLRQVRGRLLAAGLTDGQLGRIQTLLDDPRLVLAGHLLYSTSGRRAT